MSEHGMSLGPRSKSAEEGAVAVVVAVSMIMLLAAAALAVDLGSAWSTKRDLNTDLDAAALAGARTLADEVRTTPSLCEISGGRESLRADVVQSARSLLFENGNRADVADGEITIDCDRMTVRVAGSQPATTAFAGALGAGDLEPAGYAIARAVMGEGGKVLPLTFCDGIDALSSWVTAGAPPGAEVTITYGGGPRDECGFASGNWGWFGSNNVPTLRGFIDSGYPGLIQLPPERRCEGPASTPDGWCNGGTGAKPNLLAPPPSQPTIGGLKCAGPWEDCTIYTFVIHDAVRGSGTNVDYRQVAFLDAVVRDTTRAGNSSASSISLALVDWRTGSRESSAGPNSSSLCSADGAPAGDPNCDP